MIQVKTDLAGFDLISEVFREAPIALEASLPGLAEQAGQDVIDYAQYLFRLPKTGRVRQSRDGSGRMMTGSAPGEAPAIDTGKLDTSMNAVVRGFTVTVNKTMPTPYAAALEATRPFMGPSLAHAGEAYYRNILALLSRII